MLKWRLTKPLRDRIRAGHPWVYDRAVDSTAPGARAVAPAAPGRHGAPGRAPAGGSGPPASAPARHSSGRGGRGPSPDASTRPPSPAAALTAAPGDIILLVDEDGPVALALADPESPLRARVLDDPGATIDAAWVRTRVAAAVARRQRDPLLAGCTGMRLVHGEGDRCPGLVVDLYADTAVIVFDGPAAGAFWRAHLPAVLDGLDRGGATVAHVWVRGERRDRSSAAAARGNPPALVTITEDEARFAVDVRAGQKTGFFLDQRDNRRTIRRHAAGATVLNVFSYTGGFSLHAALGGASQVTSVDLAAPAIAALRENVVLSGLPLEAHETHAIDAFEFFARAAARRRTWDLVIVDPPSFAPSERAKQAGLGAYRKLAQAALAVTAPGGRFALASCSSHVTEADLIEVAAVAAVTPHGPAASAHDVRHLALRVCAGAASDHPVLPAFPEGRYLKFLLFDAP